AYRRDAVGLEAGAGEEVTAGNVSRGAWQDPLASPILNADELARGIHRAAAGSDFIGQCKRHPAKVDDPGRRRPERAQARRVRLDLCDPLRSDLAQTFDAIGLSPLPQGLKPRPFFLGQGHNELAAMLDGNFMLPSEALELSHAFTTETT